MRSRYSTLRNRADSIARHIGREYRNWGVGSLSTSPDYSPISLFRETTRPYRARLPGKTVSDMEHYIRCAQQIINGCCERSTPRARDLVPGDVEAIEAELVSRLMASAHRLGVDLGALLTWLEHQEDRKAGILGGKRGRERVRELVRTEE